MSTKPRSALDQAGGMSFFPRMLDKIRLHARGELGEEYHANLGRGADGWCTKFLRVEYEEVKRRVLDGGDNDEDVLEWCYAQGHRLTDTDLMVWNEFVRKLGWNDVASKRLEKVKAESGLADRADIQTMAEYFEVDEGRKP